MIAKAIALEILVLTSVIYYGLDIAFGQTSPSHSLRTNRESYDLGETVRFSGKVSNVVDGKNIKVTITRPNGENITRYATPESDGSYFSTYRLDTREDMGGRWKAEILYSARSSSVTFIVRDPFFELKTDKSEYEIGDRVTITGKVRSQDSDEKRVILNILNSNGTSFERLSLRLDGREFYHSFVIEGVKATFGDWIVDVRYVNNHRSALSFNVAKSPVSISLDKAAFNPGNTINVRGIIDDEIDNDEKIALSVINPQGTVYSSEYVLPQSNGTFAHKFDLIGPSAANYGKWKIVAKYDGHNGIAEFQMRERSDAITVRTSKSIFFLDDAVWVSGSVNKVGGKDIVSIHVFTEDNRLFKYVETKANANYTYYYEIEDDLLPPDNYSILITYNGAEARTNFVKLNSTSNNGNEGNNNSSSIIVRTNKSSYTPIEKIIVSGRIPKNMLLLNGNQSLSMYVLENGTGKSVFNSSSVGVSEGRYSQLIKEQGKRWLPGEYAVVVNYDDKTMAAYFVIRSSSNNSSNGNVISNTYYLGIDNANYYHIKYNVTNGNDIHDIAIDQAKKMLVISMNNSRNNAMLSLELPRQLIDSLQQDGSDSEYLVSVTYRNGTTVTPQFTEKISGIETRMLVLEIGKEVERISIIGTQIVPEFELPAVLMMTGIVGSVIIFSSVARRWMK